MLIIKELLHIESPAPSRYSGPSRSISRTEKARQKSGTKRDKKKREAKRRENRTVQSMSTCSRCISLEHEKESNYAGHCGRVEILHHGSSFHLLLAVEWRSRCASTGPRAEGDGFLTFLSHPSSPRLSFYLALFFLTLVLVFLHFKI